MEYKLIVTDIDGTLLNDEHQIPSGNLKALKEANEKGVGVVLCSGRSLKSISAHEETLGLNKAGNYGASYHGCTIYKADTKEIIKDFRIEKEIILKAIKLTENYNFSLLIHDGDELYTFEETEYTKTYEGRCGDDVKVIKPEELNDTVSKLIVIGENEDLKRFKEDITEDITNECTHFFAASDLYEFISKEASKGNALRYLCEEVLNIDPKQTISFGDNFNDLTLIKEAGLGVAVANAVPELKEIADYVTTRNNNEGAIEEVLNKFL